MKTSRSVSFTMLTLKYQKNHATRLEDSGSSLPRGVPLPSGCAIGQSSQSCPWVHFGWSDPTQPVSWLTQPNPRGRLLPRSSTVDVPGRRALRSAGTNRLVVPPVRLATVGSRAFPVAAARTWNSLPEHTVSASTLQSFKCHLKTFLLQQSFRLAL